MRTIIETENLIKTFQNGKETSMILKQLNFSVKEGEFVSIMGPSGCGKSTLLYLLGGLDLPTSGSVKFNGEDLGKMKAKELSKLRRRELGFVFQFYNLVPNLTVEENILLPILLDGHKTKAYQKQLEEMLEIMPRERWIEITANPPLTGWTAAKILWVRNHEPENYERCRHILLPKDYIRYILTGVFATEVSDASGMQLLDVPNRCWSDEVLEKLNIDKAILGKVFESCEVTGTVLPDIAEKTGLSTETKVVGGAGDNAAAAVGTGVVKDGTAFTTIGTSGVVFAHSSQVTIDPKGRVHTCCAAVPGTWHVMGVTQAP